jgi:hypothetical protein
MVKCSYCKRDFNKRDLLEHHESYRPEKTIKVCKSCHFITHIDEITKKKSWEYDSIQNELDQLQLRIKKLKNKIDNKIPYSSAICKKYNTVCSEAFIPCSEEQPKVWEKYGQHNLENECEGCPNKADDNDYWNFLKGVIESYQSRFNYLNERKSIIAKDLKKLNEYEPKQREGSNE